MRCRSISFQERKEEREQSLERGLNSAERRVHEQENEMTELYLCSPRGKSRANAIEMQRGNER